MRLKPSRLFFTRCEGGDLSPRRRIGERTLLRRRCLRAQWRHLSRGWDGPLSVKLSSSCGLTERASRRARPSLPFMIEFDAADNDMLCCSFAGRLRRPRLRCSSCTVEISFSSIFIRLDRQRFCDDAFPLVAVSSHVRCVMSSPSGFSVQRSFAIWSTLCLMSWSAAARIEREER